MYDMVAHFTRQYAFSKGTFGPGARTKGVMAHINSEFVEIEKELADGDKGQASNEWVDVVILAVDGLMRSIQEAYPDLTTDDVADHAVSVINMKQNKNESRVWPDWRKFDANTPINHDRTHD